MSGALIRVEDIPKGDHTWFMLYHQYSMSKKRDKDFEKAIDKDMKLAKKIGIKKLIVEDNFKDFRVGDYKEVWCPENYIYLVDAAHKNGIEIYLYVVIGEAATHSELYKKYSSDWAVRGLFGRQFAGFASICYQGFAYGEGHDYISKVFCMGTEFRKYFVKEIVSVMDRYKLDGIYLDRLNWRIDCTDKRHGGEGHFDNGMIPFLEEVSGEVKKRKKKLFVVDVPMKPSAIYPDDIVRKYLELADHVLLEVMIYDKHRIKGLTQRLASYFIIDIVHKFRDRVRSLAKKVVEMIFSTDTVSNPDKIVKYVQALEKMNAKDISIFMANTSTPKGFNAVYEAAKRTGASICFMTGSKKLSDVIE
jgi:hypothetical protein